ncbi:MAG: MATE family efflux transporter [Lachnospiraceae bacterium]
MTHSEEKLGTEKIGKLILSMGIPTLIAQVINLLYNIVDRMYIGHLVGPEALTGVGLTLPIIMLISAFSAFVGAGGAPLAAIAMGQGDKKRAETILSNAVTMLCFFTVVLMVVFFFIEKPFLYLIGASDVTYPYAGAYLKIYLLGTLFVQIVIGLNPFITAQGQSKIAMLSVLIGAVLNIALDPVFIFVLKMGVRGAALATIISQFASALWTLHFLISKKTSLHIQMRYLKPQWKVIGNVAALGVSPFIMQSTESLVSVVLSSGLQKYGGDIYVGSLTILQSIMQLINIPISGFTQGVQPVLSYNYGAGNIERVKDTYKKIIMLTTAASFTITLSAMLFPGVYARIFTEDAALIAVVKKVMPIFVAGMLVFGVQMGCQTTFMGLGQAKISLFMALLRKVFLLVPFAIIFPMVTGDVMSIYFAECSADVIAATVCGIVFLCNIRKILNRGPGQNEMQ